MVLTRRSVIAEEWARRLVRSDTNPQRWEAIASAGPETPPSTILQGMFTLLDTHHYGSALVRAISRGGSRTRHRPPPFDGSTGRARGSKTHLNGMPAEAKWKPVRRSQKPTQRPSAGAPLHPLESCPTT